MLKKRMRLKKTILKRSSELSTPYFNLKIQANTEGGSRFGFIVSKKIDKRATVRNRIKRVLRSCIEESLPKIKHGYDFLFILKKEAVGKSRNDLCATVSLALSQGSLIK